jgi:hypothetical protein
VNDAAETQPGKLQARPEGRANLRPFPECKPNAGAVDPWIVLAFPAPALGLSSWDDVLATVLAVEQPHDDESVAA